MPRSDRKNPTVLEIWLNQTRVGTITNLPYDQNLFVFDDDYIRANDRPVLSLSFYDENRNLIVQPEQVQTKVPTFFSNLLPEGRLREYLAEAAGIKQIREFFLLWLLGTDLPGAVLAQDSEGTPLPPEDTATKAATKQRDERILRFSLAGVQLKFSAIGSPGKQLTIPAEGRGGAWIIKLPSPRHALVPENEYSMMKLAAAAGMDAAEVGLVPTNQIEGLPAEFSQEKANSLYVRRFDRTPEGGRIHIEDFNQIYHQFPHDKYKHYSYTNMGRDISTFLGADAVAEFIRRLAFNAVIGNGDMHLKNWSITYPDTRTPHLAPAYDFVSTIAYIDDHEMALSIAKEKDTRRLDQGLLERFAVKAGLPKHMVVETALETAERTLHAWAGMARDLPLQNHVREQIHEQLRQVPLSAQFLSGTPTKRSENTARERKNPKARRPHR